MNENETEFYLKYKEATGHELMFEPVTFKIFVDGVEYSYTPDFYDIHNLTFFEVAGTRQAFHEDKFKLKALQETYPQIKIEVVNPDTTKYDFYSLSYRNGNSTPACFDKVIEKRKARHSIIENVLGLVATGKPLKVIAEDIGVSYAVILGIAKGKTKKVCSKTYHKLEGYFSSK